MNSILYTPVVPVSQSANRIASWPCALPAHSDSAQIAAPSSSADFVQLEDLRFLSVKVLMSMAIVSMYCLLLMCR